MVHQAQHTEEIIIQGANHASMVFYYRTSCLH